MLLFKNSLYKILIIILLVLLSPVFLTVSILIFILDGFPIIFKQKRVGLNGKAFDMYKFRTMVEGADKQQNKYRQRNEADGPVFKIYDDPRFYPLGRFLSHTGLDELPQLLNILKGDMAIFGPRPLPVSEDRKLKPWMRVRSRIKPGIISPWIFDGYHSRPFDEWMRSDIEYIREKNLKTDMRLVFQTFCLTYDLIRREISSLKNTEKY